MFPLLKRDGLAVPYFVFFFLWQWLLGVPPTSLSAYEFSSIVDWATVVVHGLFYVAMLSWHGVEQFTPPPKGKPDLWTVVNVLIGAAGFGLCYAWCLGSLVRRSGLLARGDVSRDKKTQ